MRDQRPYNIAYYAAHRDEELARVQRRQRDAVSFLRDLRRVPCADCGNSFAPYVMEFDHKEPGTKSFWILQRAGSVSRDRLLTELSKCEVVCANCHRARTYARAIERREARSRGGHEPRRESRRRREQTALIQTLRVCACMDCGRQFPFYVMDFDHRVPGEKAFEITRMLGRTSTQNLLDEIAKCDIVCANCHRERTFRRRSKNAGVA